MYGFSSFNPYSEFGFATRFDPSFASTNGGFFGGSLAQDRSLGSVTGAIAGLATADNVTSGQKTGVTSGDLYKLLAADQNLGDTTREWLSSFQGGQQDTNNIYSLFEAMYANDLSQSNAREANRVARENAELAFLRQKELDQAAMNFNAEQSQIARDFQMELSNTAYQRGMADLKAAGLNPILAYSQGGASTPSANGASFGGSSASQASSFYAQTQRQQIDQRSKTDLIKAYISAVSSLGNTAVSTYGNITSSLMKVLSFL